MTYQESWIFGKLVYKMATENFEKLIEKLDEKEKSFWRGSLNAFSKSSNQKKEELFIAHLLLTNIIATKIPELLEKVINALDYIDQKKLNKEVKEDVKEIENIISLGIPGWFKYTRSNKKTKK